MNMLSSWRRLALVSLMAAGTASGCAPETQTPSTPATESPAAESPTPGDVQHDAIEGRVDLKNLPAGEDTEGCVVRVLGVNADGSVDVVSRADVEATIDENGQYRVELTAAAAFARDLIVEADFGDHHWSVIVSRGFSGSVTLVAEPMTLETTLEADVWLELQAHEEFVHAGCVSAQVKDWITAELAVAVSISKEAAFDLTVEVIKQALIEFNLALGDVEEASSSLAIALEAHAKADCERALSLAIATTEAEIEAAHSAYHQAVLEAYVAAGISLDLLSYATSCAIEVTRTLTVEAGVSVEAPVCAALRVAVELRQAFAVAASLAAKVEGHLAVSFELALEHLVAKLVACHDLHEGLEAAIHAAWAEFVAEVEVVLCAGLGVDVGIVTSTLFEALADCIAEVLASVSFSREVAFEIDCELRTLLSKLCGAEFAASLEVAIEAAHELLVHHGLSVSADLLVDLLLTVNLAAH